MNSKEQSIINEIRNNILNELTRWTMLYGDNYKYRGSTRLLRRRFIENQVAILMESLAKLDNYLMEDINS